MDRRKPIPDNIQRRILKIFVTNLPEGCSGNDLAGHVRLFGQIFDLYIARKRDKGGNRFGFISFLDVKDKEELLRNLRNIRMGGYKLWFNIARFVLEEGKINSFRDEKSSKSKSSKGKQIHVEGIGGSKTGTSEVGDRSFKDMLVGKSVTVDNNANGFRSLHGLAVVVRMVDFHCLKSIKVIVKEMSFQAVRFQYIGGLDLLITFSNVELAIKFKVDALALKDKFSMVATWEGQVLGFERLAWLKIQGIPLHVLSNEVIDSVGGLFGRIVHKATRSENDVDLS
ncbi:putative RNA recognition motif domain, nucleotide-binding alpha-beta plait domain superfamily [Helianthus annuus]|uniref:RNA recognition motif domain, nucleotide-binding alpha-beta plait domain superfamily n=1 Tax=Helianthus annuus TaxID=4232 RepID=A0A9K3JNG2_HELAN|nr:putative RNA recognition motif domain, nucleotide-binding alpha-beta plait domain superfamily [Helianthus annuus]KAJ0604995.1 putative RNA recognition motif domain, nucleotide-binding alpha-beta plait domain superfamily [Helianthus annuus]KAJ0619009.1 putative RNA recognition motif domain, nucleotide-binding alpha-beta plait domain superfamily [Helianthus annuus]KAJ0777463.1 putative RNA recognition motif domain, nucleotide-binding alpha-beta plait domain superfamily [Helianthus annuus]KAJ09